MVFLKLLASSAMLMSAPHCDKTGVIKFNPPLQQGVQCEAKINGVAFSGGCGQNPETSSQLNECVTVSAVQQMCSITGSCQLPGANTIQFDFKTDNGDVILQPMTAQINQDASGNLVIASVSNLNQSCDINSGQCQID